VKNSTNKFEMLSNLEQTFI